MPFYRSDLLIPHITIHTVLSLYLLVTQFSTRASANCGHGSAQPSIGDSCGALNIRVVDTRERIYLVEVSVAASEKKLLEVPVAAVLYHHH